LQSHEQTKKKQHHKECCSQDHLSRDQAETKTSVLKEIKTRPKVCAVETKTRPRVCGVETKARPSHGETESRPRQELLKI